MVKPKRRFTKPKTEVDKVQKNKSVSGDNDILEAKESNLSSNTKEKTVPRPIYMEALPKTFKSLVSCLIEIISEEPQEVIELLGEALGILDYKTNMAAFWFLDNLALHVIKYRSRHNAFYRGIFVSWLAGALKMIQVKNPSREEFFNQINDLFCETMNDINDSKPLLHWEIIISHKNMDSFTNIFQESNVKSTVKYANNYSKKSKNLQLAPRENIEQETQNFNHEASPNVDTVTDVNDIDVFNTIVEATFDMYAGEFRYFLIQEAFVKKVKLHYFTLPYILQKPRKIKIVNVEDTFEMQLAEMLKSEAKKKTSERQDTVTSRKNSSKKTTSSRTAASNEYEKVIHAPPPSLIDEEILRKNQEFILPLIEAREAYEVIQKHISGKEEDNNK